jgi:hypothetical protein
LYLGVSSSFTQGNETVIISAQEHRETDYVSRRRRRGAHLRRAQHHQMSLTGKVEKIQD